MSPATLLRAWQLAAALVAAALLVTGCSSSSSQPNDGTPTSVATDTPAGPSQPASPGATEPGMTPSPSSTPAGAEAEEVIAAAKAELDARYVSPLTRDACLEGNDAEQLCIALASGEAAVLGGIARFDAGDPNGGPFSFFMGRDATGAWRYWFGTQQQSYILQELPGDLLACGLDNATTVRAQPSAEAEAITTLEAGASLSAVEFTLTLAGTFGAGSERGDGWYRVSAPAEGWVNAREITDAALGDCLLHDAIERVAHG